MRMYQNNKKKSLHDHEREYLQIILKLEEYISGIMDQSIDFN